MVLSRERCSETRGEVFLCCIFLWSIRVIWEIWTVMRKLSFDVWPSPCSWWHLITRRCLVDFWATEGFYRMMLHIQCWFLFFCFFFFNLLKLCDTSWYEIWVYPELVSYCWWNKNEVKTMNVNSLVGSQLKEVSTLSKLKCQENTLYMRTIAYLDLICT